MRASQRGQGRGCEPHEEDEDEGDMRPRVVISLRCGVAATSRLYGTQAAMELSGCPHASVLSSCVGVAQMSSVWYVWFQLSSVTAREATRGLRGQGRA